MNTAELIKEILSLFSKESKGQLTQDDDDKFEVLKLTLGQKLSRLSNTSCPISAMKELGLDKLSDLGLSEEEEPLLISIFLVGVVSTIMQ